MSRTIDYLFEEFVDDENQQNDQQWWHHLLRSQRVSYLDEVRRRAPFLSGATVREVKV